MVWPPEGIHRLALPVFRQVAAALCAAHETSYLDELGFEVRSVLHGDVKPANIIVDATGSVEKARVIRGLHADLDEQALIAARQWTFKPGVLNGRAVPVSTVLVLEFRIH